MTIETLELNVWN